MTTTKNITDLNALQTPQTDDVLLIVERLSSTSTEAKQITWGNVTEAIQDIIGGLIVSDTNSPSTITISYDDAGAELVARVQPDTTVQKVEVTDGSTVASRKRINIDDGIGISATVTDDVPNNQSIVSIKNSGIVNASTNSVTGTTYTLLSGATLQNDGSKTLEIRPLRLGSSKITATFVESNAGLELDIDPSQIPINSLDATVQLPISKGGTGAADAPTARTNLGAAKTGANSDISALSGLTTPLSVAQGGTGANTASGALVNLNGINSVAGVGQVGEQIVYQSSVLSSGQYRAELKGIKPTSQNYITVTTENSDIALGVNPNVIFDAVSGTRTINNARIQNAANPVNGQDLATKSYVDATSSGLAVKDSVRVATTANLAATYDGATQRLTLTSQGVLVIDTITMVVNDRVLVKDQTDKRRNGIYKVISVGSSSASPILERADDMDQSSEVATGAFTFIQEGALSANRSFVQTATNVTLDSSDITFSVFGDYTIGVNTITNNKFAQVSSNLVKGRVSSGTGDIEDITADQLIDILNTASTSTINSARVVQVATADGSITNAKLSDVSAGTLKGRPSTETTSGAPTDLNADQVIQLINSATTQTIASARLVIPAIQDEEVTNAMLAHVDQYRVKGRITTSSGDVEDLTPDNLITLINQASTNTINTAQTAKHSIASNEVTNANLADMSANTIKGRISTNGDPQDLSADNVLTIINGATGSLNTARISSGALGLDKLSSVSTNTLLGRTASGSGAVSAIDADGVLSIFNQASGTINSARIANNSVSDSKLGNINQYQVKGRISSGSGSVETLSADNLIQIINQAASQTINTARTVDHGTSDNAITNAKLSDIAQYRVKGRVSSGSGDPQDLTADNVITIINQGSTAFSTGRIPSVSNSMLASMGGSTLKGNASTGSAAASDLGANDVYTVLRTGTTDAGFCNTSGAPVTVGKRGGNVNTMVGVNTGQSVTVSGFAGNANTCIGYHAGLKITSGMHNVMLGAISGGQTTGNYCVSVGWQSGGARQTTMQATGTNNVSIAPFSNGYLTSGEGNVSMGHAAGENITTASRNTFIGAFAGQAAVYSGSNGSDTITTTNDNVCIGYGAGPSSNTASGEVVLGNFAQSVLRCNVSGISALSDRRDKTNIQDIPVGLDFVNQLRPVKFQWNHRTTENALNGTLAAGFIAQEAKETCTNNNADYLNLVNDSQPEALEMSPTNIIPVLVKAVQELSAEVTSLRSQLEALS